MADKHNNCVLEQAWYEKVSACGQSSTFLREFFILIKFAGFEIPLPASMIVRIFMGVLLVLFGLVGFLPIVGYWMIPFGLLVLSYDIPRVRRWRRQIEVSWGRWRQRRKEAKRDVDPESGAK